MGGAGRIAMHHREGYLHANRGFRGRGESNATGDPALPADVGLTPEQRFLFVRSRSLFHTCPGPQSAPVQS